MSESINKVSAALSLAQLQKMRNEAGDNPALQQVLGPMEHQAFAREYAQNSPVQAAVSLPFAIPLWTAAKALGIQPARSPASLEEIKSGYTGLLQGLGLME